jgi:hypothetical protein
MSGPLGSSQWMYSSGGFYPTEIDQSLMFDGTAYLTRTPSVAGDRRTWTYSSWFKRWSLTPAAGGQSLFYAGDTTVSPRGGIVFGDAGDDKLSINGVPFNSTTLVLSLVTTAQYRDPSAWYHLVVALDTTQATASDRCKMYVNGVQVTAFGTATYPSLNQELQYNDAILHATRHPSGDYKFVGYLADTYFVDGTALDPTSFGEFKSGVWIPKRYTGSYGTNGFHLEYNDNANDSSGTGNNWTATNIVAGDYMLDSPTNNYATLNPLAIGTSQLSLSDGNLKATPTSGASNWGTAFSTINIPSTGKYYAEGMAFISAGLGNTSHFGVLDSAMFIPTNTNITYAYTAGEGFDGLVISLFNDTGTPYSDGVGGTGVSGLTATTVNVMLAIDIDAGKVWSGYNGTWFNSGNPAAGTGNIATRNFTTTDVIAVGTAWNGANDQGMSANFGQSGFTYTPPTDFLALSTANLPEPSISPLYGASPQDHFNTVTYTGDGATSKSITSVNFKPDLNWVKQRNLAQSHTLTDTVRGAGFILSSDATSADYSATTYGQVTSFDTDGFTVSKGSNPTYSYYNQSGGSYVAWNWKASNATAVSNTEGSITSQVSANTTAGFSIVSYTGTGSAATVGHGLGVAPSMMIVKQRNDAQSWAVYHASNGAANVQYLDLTDAVASSTAWNSTTPASSVFSVGTSAATNGSSNTYIAYCFNSVEGYSKFGSYTGNGSADGPFVYTGFRPAYVMIKRTDSTGYWQIIDTSRSPYNVANATLYPNASLAEDSTNTNLDALANGYKIRGTPSTDFNTNGSTYIYMAFAENPFKYANAR